MKKILLIFPGQLNARDANIPLALLHVAKPLLDNGFEVEVFDSRLRHYKKMDLDGVLCAGITATSGRQVGFAVEIARHIRSVNSRMPIVWGGPHVTSLVQQTAESDLVDYAVYGEGELTLLELAEALKRGDSVNGHVKGLAFKVNCGVVVTSPREPIDVDRIGPLPYHLLDMSAYPNVVEKFEYITSKGCPHNCGFCSNATNYGRTWRAKTSQTVLDEMDSILKTFKPKRIIIHDANFFVNKKRVREICEGIVERKWALELNAFGRCDYFSKYDDSLLDLLYRAGFKELAFGAESGDDAILEFINKGTNAEEIVATVEKFKKHNIRSVISFMMGFPDETEDQLRATLKLYDRIMQIDPHAMVNGMFIFTPFPGSSLTGLVEKEYGYVPPKSLEEWSDWLWSSKENITWVQDTVKKRYESINMVVRYLFVEKSLKSWSFSQLKARSGSALTAAAVFLFNLAFSVPAHVRWKYRLFRFPIELKLWRSVLRWFKDID